MGHQFQEVHSRMKVLFLVLALVATAKSSQPNLEEFDKMFGILEAVPDDKKAEEEQKLKEVEAEIEAQNEAYANGEATFDEKLTPMADIPKEDFEKMFEGMNMPEEMTRATGLIMPPESERNTPENQANLEVAYRELAMTRQASSWDSRAKGWVTAVKNQGSCGSCAAFAAHAVHEVSLVKAGANITGLDLSEQHLIDCAYDGDSMSGCNGASPHAYQNWFAKNGGVSKHESKYPYLGTSPKLTCTAAKKVANWSPGYKISKATWDYKCTEGKLKKLVKSKGAVAVGVYAADNDFYSYKSGVFNKCSKNDRRSCNHAVVVVGYGNDKKLGKYWIVKNSWGTNWGDKGYIKIKRGNTTCGIGTVCTWTDAAANGSANTIPATTTTAAPSSSSKMWCDLTTLFKDMGVSGAVTGGPYRLRLWNGSKMFYSVIKCKASKCTPAVAGQTNACKYICGRNTC